VGQTTYPLPDPFFTIATQNPIEQEGTYPLPEAQLDRFMFNIMIEYSSEAEELEIVRTTTRLPGEALKPVVTGSDIVAFQQLVRRVPVPEPVLRYAVTLVRTTRPGFAGVPPWVGEWVSYGASVRAAQYLILGAKARALLQGRYHVKFDDVRALAHPVLRHRILKNFHAESERVTTDQLVDRLLESVPVPSSGM
jgi:MoxR-like ATPase